MLFLMGLKASICIKVEDLWRKEEIKMIGNTLSESVVLLNPPAYPHYLAIFLIEN